MNQLFLRIATQKIREWDGILKQHKIGAKTCFADQLIGSKLKIELTKQFSKLDLMFSIKT